MKMRVRMAVAVLAMVLGAGGARGQGHFFPDSSFNTNYGPSSPCWDCTATHGCWTIGVTQSVLHAQSAPHVSFDGYVYSSNSIAPALWYNAHGNSTPIAVSNDCWVECSDVVGLGYDEPNDFSATWHRPPSIMCGWNATGYAIQTNDPNVYAWTAIAINPMFPTTTQWRHTSWEMGTWAGMQPHLDIWPVYSWPSIFQPAPMNPHPTVPLWPPNPNQPPQLPGHIKPTWNPFEGTPMEGHAQWSVRGDYGDTFTFQSKNTLGEPWTTTTNIVASTNNVTVISNCVAYLSTDIPIAGTNHSYFLSCYSGDTPAAEMFGCYEIYVPAHSGFAVAQQLWDGNVLLTNALDATNLLGSFSTYLYGTNKEVDVASGAWPANDLTAQLSIFQGGLFWNSNSTDVHFVLSGEVMQGQVTNAIPAGTSFQSWPRPEPINLHAAGFPAVEGDVVYKWNPSNSTWTTYTYSWTNRVHAPHGSGQWVTNWWGPSVPQFGVGESFKVTKVHATNWVIYLRDNQRFSVQVSGLSDTNITDVQVTCPTAGISHQWSYGQDALNLCIDDSILLTTSDASAEAHDSPWTPATMGITDNYNDGTASLNLTLGTNEVSHFFYVIGNDVTNFAFGTYYQVNLPGAGTNLAVTSMQMAPTNTILTVGNVSSGLRYYVWEKSDLPGSWTNSAQFVPSQAGNYSVRVARDPAEAQRFYRVSR